MGFLITIFSILKTEILHKISYHSSMAFDLMFTWPNFRTQDYWRDTSVKVKIIARMIIFERILHWKCK